LKAAVSDNPEKKNNST